MAFYDLRDFTAFLSQAGPEATIGVLRTYDARVSLVELEARTLKGFEQPVLVVSAGTSVGR